MGAGCYKLDRENPLVHHVIKYPVSLPRPGLIATFTQTAILNVANLTYVGFDPVTDSTLLDILLV